MNEAIEEVRECHRDLAILFMHKLTVGIEHSQKDLEVEENVHDGLEDELDLFGLLWGVITVIILCRWG